MDIELAQALEENAELKDQLTKAKELLNRFIETSNPIYFEEDRQKVKVEAEQFLIEPDDRFEVTEKGKEYLNSH